MTQENISQLKKDFEELEKARSKSSKEQNVTTNL